MKESVIEKEIFLWLDEGGFFPIKYENKASFGGKGFFFQGKMKRYGISDLMFFVGGKVVFCEVKKPDVLKKIENNLETVHNFVIPTFPRTEQGRKDKKAWHTKNHEIKRYKEQQDFLHTVRGHGQIGIMVTSIEDVKREITNYFKTVPRILLLTNHEREFFKPT